MVGPVPPQTLEAILAATPSLTRDLTPETRQSILFILRGVALARLDSIDERQALDAIKTKTGLPIGDLRRQLAGFRREMGLATANKQRWASQLIIGDDGTPRAVTANAVIALSEDAAFKETIRHDKLLCQTMLTASAPWEEITKRRLWRDRDDREAQIWLQHNGIMVSLDATRDAIQTVAERNPYHPMMNYFNEIHWDGKPRLDTWLVDYLGAEDSPYIRAIGPCWMISGVARIWEPGCQVDTALVLEGPQGTFKSSVFAVLGGEWYTSDIAQLGTKNAQERIIGVWIVELDEMEAVTRAADIAAVKSSISRRFDRFRYTRGRRVDVYQRQCIFGGTVNKDTWQRDETGGRRWWPTITRSLRRVQPLWSAPQPRYARSVWSRPPVLRCQRDQARLLRPAASTDP